MLDYSNQNIGKLYFYTIFIYISPLSIRLWVLFAEKNVLFGSYFQLFGIIRYYPVLFGIKSNPDLSSGVWYFTELPYQPIKPREVSFCFPFTLPLETIIDVLNIIVFSMKFSGKYTSFSFVRTTLIFPIVLEVFMQIRSLVFVIDPVFATSPHPPSWIFQWVEYRRIS